MTLRRSYLFGLAALVVCACQPGRQTQPQGGVPMFEEASDSIRELLVHFDPVMVHELFPIYRDLAAALDPATTVAAAVPTIEDGPAARAMLLGAGFGPHRIRILACDSELSVWARDRVIPQHSGGRWSFFRPLPMDTDDKGKCGDLEVARQLALESGGELRSGLCLEGGNVVVGAGHVFVGNTVFKDNPTLGHEGVLTRLKELFGQTPVVLGVDRGVPHPHVDMFLSVIDPRTVLLGDPGAGAELLQSLEASGLNRFFESDQGVFDPGRQRYLVPVYEAIRLQLLQLGLRVKRIPILHSDTDVVLTWNNAVIERRGNSCHAYVPVYGLPKFDREALTTYEEAGVTAHPIDASRLVSFGGTVRCATNVVRWKRSTRGQRN